MLKRIHLTRLFKIVPLLLSVVEDVPVLFRMLRSFASGSYKNISMRALLRIAFALCYIFILTDFIPDFIPFIGWLDDITVFAWVVNSLKSEAEAYRKCEAGN